MFVDQLGHAVAAQQNAEIIEPGDDALELHAVHQEDGDGNLLLAHMVEERVLQVLLLFLGMVKRAGDGQNCRAS